jgi:hypothetical protein
MKSLQPAHRRSLVVVGALLALTLCPAAALAGPPGKWTRVTGIDGVEASNIDEIGLERTADGVLHVAWAREPLNAPGVVLHSAIAADAASIVGPVTIASFGNGVNKSVDLVAGPSGGLRALFSGLVPGGPYDGVVATATAPAAGQPWSAPSAASNNSVADASPVYAASGIGGGVGLDGTVVSAWGDSSPSGGGFHVGLVPTDLDSHFDATCCQTDPSVGVDAVSGATVLAWNTLGATESVQVRTLPAGPTLTAPKSGAPWIGQRVSISGRIGADGVYVAYGSGSNPFLANPAWWRVGAPQAKVLNRKRDAEQTGLTPGPDGRLWLYWEQQGNKRVFAARSNPAATRLGALVSIKPPRGTQTIYALHAEGSAGPLDLFALADAAGGIGYFHQRIKPGLTLKAAPGKVAAGGNVTFMVTDAGAAVSGANVKVTIAGDKLGGLSNAAGKVTVHVPGDAQPRRYRATAKKAGYAQATRQIRVKP